MGSVPESCSICTLIDGGDRNTDTGEHGNNSHTVRTGRTIYKQVNMSLRKESRKRNWQCMGALFNPSLADLLPLFS